MKHYVVFGLCAICNRPSALVVDHDHQSWFGMVRGLVCLPCNGHLGRVEKGKMGKMGKSEFLYDVIYYLAVPPLARRRVSYWWLKYVDVWMERRQKRIDEIHAWLAGTPLIRARY